MIFQEVKDNITQDEVVNAKNAVKNELKRIENSNIGVENLEKAISLINKYISCEIIYKELLKSVKDKNSKSKKVKTSKDLIIKIDEVKSVFNIFDYKYDENLLENIFGSRKNRNYCSMKILRNNIVHNKSKNDINEAADRYDVLNGYMDRFLTQIRNFNDNETEV